jgi:hypothetical protein
VCDWKDWDAHATAATSAQGRTLVTATLFSSTGADFPKTIKLSQPMAVHWSHHPIQLNSRRFGVERIKMSQLHI